MDHIVSSQLVHPVWLFSGCIQQLPSDGYSPAKEIATWSLWGLSPWWTLPPPKPPTWGLLWLLLLFRLFDSCPEPQSMGHNILNDSYSLFVHWPSDRTCSQMVSEQGGREGGSTLAPPAGSRRVPPQGLELGIKCSSPRWNVLLWVPTRVTAPGLGNLISPARDPWSQCKPTKQGFSFLCQDRGAPWRCGPCLLYQSRVSPWQGPLPPTFNQGPINDSAHWRCSGCGGTNGFHCAQCLGWNRGLFRCSAEWATSRRQRGAASPLKGTRENPQH